MFWTVPHAAAGMNPRLPSIWVVGVLFAYGQTPTPSNRLTLSDWQLSALLTPGDVHFDDRDGDGAFETGLRDTDNDGLFDQQWRDADGDGIPEREEWRALTPPKQVADPRLLAR